MSKMFSREDTLFADALAQPANQRAAFLQQACGADTALRFRIEALLAAHDGPDVLDPPHFTAVPGERPGGRIGRYKLLQRIGEGGCGVVYMAAQEEPVRRRVALKVIKAGMDTREVIARFSTERQALALMDHPGIAKVLDAGATESGRPFFVMELVRGMPITKYCDAENLTTAARIKLFIQVCHAVQHAHQKGIIHRDLKPSNILVTQNETGAAPKVIDFGIAKATQGPLTDATVVTVFEQFIGTPAYMSPEQAEMNGLDIDTRSDVYSLGVLLYELLTGRPPFDPKALGRSPRDEIRRIIREVEPPRPSLHVSTLADADRTTVAKLRGTDPVKLSLQLRGDLDWIVMRALEKHRAQRYETPLALAADLTRYLAHEPVLARSPSRLYRLRKAIRRNRLACAAAAAIVATLVAGTIASTWQAVRATRAERAAKAARDNAEAASVRAQTLLDFMLGPLRAEVQRVGNLELLDMVGAQSKAYFTSLGTSDEALLQQVVSLRQTGEVKLAKALFPEAAASFMTAYERAAELVAHHPDNDDMLFERAQAEFYNGVTYRSLGNLPAATEWLTRYRDSSAELLRLSPQKWEWQRESLSGLHNLAVLNLDRGQFADARAGFTNEMAMAEKMIAATPADVSLQYKIADIHSWLGTLAERTGDLSAAADRFARQISVLNSMTTKSPRDTKWQLSFAEAQALHASVLSITGQRSGAQQACAQARRLFDSLVKRDAENREWLIESLTFRVKESLLTRAAGDVRAAAEWLAPAREGLEKLAAGESPKRRVAEFLLAAWRLEAELRHAAGRADAEEAAARAETLGDSFVRRGWISDFVIGDYAGGCLIAGAVAAAKGQPEVARGHWQRAADLLAPLTRESSHWRVLDPAARVLAQLGQPGESRALIARLEKLGYQPLEPWPEVAAQDPLAPTANNPETQQQKSSP